MAHDSMTGATLRGLLAALALGCMGAPPPGAPTPPGDREAMAAEYRTWLDRGRTPTRLLALVLEQSPGFTVVDPVHGEFPAETKNWPGNRPGDRLVFVNRDRTAVLVVVGELPLASAGARLLGAHIDTPAPRLSLVGVTAKGQHTVLAHSYGGMRWHHWLHRPLALVGQVARSGQPADIEISVGLDDDFALYAVTYDARARALLVTTAGTVGGGKDAASPTLVGELNRRYGLTASDLQAAELYLVPREKAREVGIDRSLIGGHGQDDRANSYVSWRAILDLPRVPRHTAVTWLVDQEEVGSAHVAGSQSRFFELVFAYLLRAQGAPASEASLARAFAASQAISADTPPALNPNWPEVHDRMNVPILGRGPSMTPFTGSGGKRGGDQAHAELIRSVMSSFQRAGVKLQFGQLGRVDEGGGNTIAKFLSKRGIDVVDIGVPVVSMHSPLELTAKDDLFATYRAFRAWLVE